MDIALPESLVGQLTVLRSNLTAVLIAISYLDKTPAGDTLERRTVIVSRTGFRVLPKTPRPDEVSKDDYISSVHVGSADGRNLLVSGPASAAVRSLILESFEVTKTRCVETGLGPVLRKEPWYHYVRLLRNALTHGGYWSFRRYDRNLLPLSWSGLTISAEMDGAVVSGQFADWYRALEISDALIDFAERLSK